MSRLALAGIHSIVWQEDEDDNIVFAEGLQAYEIDENNELAIFQGPNCVKVFECKTLEHAVSIAEASERVCRRNIALGHANGYPINEKGWRV